MKKTLFKVLYSIFITLIVLSFVFMFMALGKRSVDNSFDNKTIQDLNEEWTVQVGQEPLFKVNLPVKFENKNNSKVSISRILPSDIDSYNCMMIESKRQEIYVYVDDELRASYTDEGQKIGNSLPSSYLMVPIHNADAGLKVQIDFITDTYYSGNISNIYLGSEMSILIMLIKTNMIWLILIGVIAVIGFVCLTCYFMYRSTFSDSIQFLHLFLFSLFTTIWCFSQINIRQIFIKDLSVCESIGHCCFMLIPFSILLISNYFSDYRHPTFHQFGITVAIVSFLAQNIVHTGFGIDYFQLQPITQLYTFWILTTCIGSCVIDIFKGRLGNRYWVIVGFVGQVLGIIAEAVLTGMGVRYTHLGYYILGSLVFVLSIAFNIFLDFREVQRAKNEAENANKAKSMFLATMSHEIRTPINVVLGMNELIIRETASNIIRDYANNIAEAGKSLLSLVNDILDFSKIESGKMDIVCVDYNLKPLINDLVMMTKTRIGNKDIKLVLNIDETIPSKYYGDEVRIKQILTNILTNSVKYTEAGTIELTVRSAGRQDEDILLTFSVKDTGMGMKPENIEKLMSSTFIRFDEQKNRNIEGTGLGVAITRQLLELMGSKLEIDSTYGSGSDFYFTLKQRVVDETALGAVEQKTDSSKQKRKNSFTAKGANILAVDDTKTNLLVIKGLLKPYEMNVEVVSSGRECINKCKEKQYDVILMDHMMPEMDGIATLSELRKEKLITDDTKVIALTANAISGAEEMYISNGFDGYLTKPIDVIALDLCLKKSLPNGRVKSIKQPFLT